MMMMMMMRMAGAHRGRLAERWPKLQTATRRK